MWGGCNKYINHRQFHGIWGNPRSTWPNAGLVKYGETNSKKNMDVHAHGSLNVPFFHITQPWMVYGQCHGYFFQVMSFIFPIYGTGKPTPETTMNPTYIKIWDPIITSWRPCARLGLVIFDYSWWPRRPLCAFTGLFHLFPDKFLWIPWVNHHFFQKTSKSQFSPSFLQHFPMGKSWFSPKNATPKNGWQWCIWHHSSRRSQASPTYF